MKNAFSLYTFLPSVFGGLCLGCTESHAKNITSLQMSNVFIPHWCNYSIEKFLIFSVHLVIYALKPVFTEQNGVQRKKILCTPPYTFVL
jgi:hypothetical protein